MVLHYKYLMLKPFPFFYMLILDIAFNYKQMLELQLFSVKLLKSLQLASIFHMLYIVFNYLSLPMKCISKACKIFKNLAKRISFNEEMKRFFHEKNIMKRHSCLAQNDYHLQFWKQIIVIFNPIFLLTFMIELRHKEKSFMLNLLC